MSTQRKYSESDWLRFLPVAHRGLHDGQSAPENSLAAFRLAAEAGYAIELDVRVTRDREVVVFHDEDLCRSCGMNRKVSELTLRELRGARLFGSEERIPTLAEALAAVDGRVPLLIEIKRGEGDRSFDDSVLGLIRDYSVRHHGKVALQSFNPFTVRWFRRHAPELPAGLLSGRFDDESLSSVKRWILRYLLLFAWVKPSFIAYEFREAPWGLLQLLARHTRLPFLLWTIRSEEEAACARAQEMNVIFEGIRPARPPLA